MAPIFVLLKLLVDPDVSNKVILQLAFRQVKAIGYAKVFAMLLSAQMVAVSSFIKVPQIKKIMKPDTVEGRIQRASGLAKKSVALETLSQFVHVAYNQQQRNLFINYGEAFLVGVQNVAILVILEYYKLREQIRLCSPELSEKEQVQEALKKLARPAAVIVGAVVFILKLAPRKLVSALKVVSIPIAVLAKIPQIRRNAELRSTAHLSEVTVGANVLGSLIRVFTTASNFRRGRDELLLAGYVTSLGLNATITGQMIHYGKEKQE